MQNTETLIPSSILKRTFTFSDFFLMHHSKTGDAYSFLLFIVVPGRWRIRDGWRWKWCCMKGRILHKVIIYCSFIHCLRQHYVLRDISEQNCSQNVFFVYTSSLWQTQPVVLHVPVNPPLLLQTQSQLEQPVPVKRHWTIDLWLSLKDGQLCCSQNTIITIISRHYRHLWLVWTYVEKISVRQSVDM